MSSQGATTTTSSAPPPQVMQNYTQLTGAATGVAQQPLNLYTAPVVAGFTPQQQQAFQDVQNASGIQTPYINAAAQEYATATTPLWPTLPTFGTGSVNTYLNPYTTDVTNQLTNLYDQQNAQAAAQLAGQSTTAGAYGGDREAVAQGIQTQQEQMAQAPTLAQVQQQGYQQAVNEFNNQQATQLAAEQANSWLASQAGFGLAGLGSQAQSAALQGASAEMQAGAAQQALAQQQLNVPYQQYQQTQAYPYQQLSFLTPIVEGTGSLSGGTGSTTQPPPSMLGQVAGAATAGAGLINAFPSSPSYPPVDYATNPTGGFARGGRLGFADGGGIGSGGLNLPGSPSGGIGTLNFPDLSISFIPPPPTSAGGKSMFNPTQPDVTTTTSGGGGGILGAVGPLLTIAKFVVPLIGAKDGGAMREHRAAGGTGGIGDYTSLATPALPVPTLELPWLKMMQHQQGSHMGAGPPKAPTPGAAPDPMKGVQDLGGAVGSLGKLFNSDSTGGDYGGGGDSTTTGKSGGGAIGRAHYQTGGPGPTSVPTSVMAQFGGAPPNVQSQLQQLLQLPLAQLQEMAVQYPPTTSQGQMIAQAIAQKQATPGSGTAPQTPAPQQPFVGLGGSGGSTGGTASLATSPESYGGTSHLASGGQAEAADTRGYVTPEELDPRPVVDHSGSTVKVNYPSEGKSLDLGLPPIRPERRAAGGSAGAAMPVVPHVSLSGGEWAPVPTSDASAPAHLPITGPANNAPLGGTQQAGENNTSPAAFFTSSMPTANGVAIPQLSNQMFGPVQGVTPGSGLPGWYAPLPQQTVFGTGPGGSTIFPTSTAFTPAMAPITSVYGGSVPTWAGGSSAPAPATGGTMTQDQIDQMNAATTAANYAQAASGYKRGGRFGEGGGIGGSRPFRGHFDEGGDLNPGDELPIPSAPVDAGYVDAGVAGSGAGPGTLDLLQEREAEDRVRADRALAKITASAEGKGGIGKSVTGHPMLMREPSAPLAPAPVFPDTGGSGTMDILQAHQAVSDALDQAGPRKHAVEAPGIPPTIPPAVSPDTAIMLQAHDDEGNAIDTTPEPTPRGVEPPTPELRATPTSPRNEQVSQATQDVLREHGEMPSEPFYGRAIPFSQLPERGGGPPVQYGMPSEGRGGIGMPSEAAVPVTPTGIKGGIGTDYVEPPPPDWTQPEYWTRQRYEQWNPATQPVPSAPAAPTPMPQRPVVATEGPMPQRQVTPPATAEAPAAAPEAPAVTTPTTVSAATKPDLFAPAPTTAAAPATAPAAAPEVWGDSLGVGVHNVLKSPGGYQHGGDDPKTVFGEIRKQPENHWQGKDVILSSGTNGNDMPTVLETMNYLKGHGANVAVIGYGSKYADRDAQLQQYAKDAGVAYVKAGVNDGTHMSPGGYADATARAQQALATSRAPRAMADGDVYASDPKSPNSGAVIPSTPTPAAPDARKSAAQTNAKTAIDTMAGLGGSKVFQAAGLTHAMYEGGFADNWVLSGIPGEDSRGHLQFNANGQRPLYERWLAANGKPVDSHSTADQFAYMTQWVKTHHPEALTTNDPRVAMDAIGDFEHYTGYAPGQGQRMGNYPIAEKMVNGDLSVTPSGPIGGTRGGGGAGGGAAGAGTGANPNAPPATPENVSNAARQLSAQAPPHERNALYTWLHSPGGMLFMIGAGMLASGSPYPGVALGQGLEFAAKGLMTGEAQENKNELAEIRAEHYREMADAAAGKLGLTQQLGEGRLANQQTQLQLTAERLANSQQVAQNNILIATQKLDLAKSAEERRLAEGQRRDAIKMMIGLQPKGEMAILQAVMDQPNGPKTIPEAEAAIAAAKRDPSKAQGVQVAIEAEARKRASLDLQAHNADPTNIGRTFDTQAATKQHLDELRATLGATAAPAAPAPAAPAAAPQGAPAAQGAKPDWAVPVLGDQHYLDGKPIFTDGRAWYFGDHTPAGAAATQ